MVSDDLEDGLEEEFGGSKDSVPVQLIHMSNIQDKSNEYPYNLICHLKMIFDNGINRSIEYGTGSLIHKNVLITSAHNCYNFFDEPQFKGKAFATEVTITPSGGFSNSSKTINIRKSGPNANCFISSGWFNMIESAPNVPPEWIKMIENEPNSKDLTFIGDSRANDIAFIILDDPFQFSKYFSLKYQPNLLESHICCCNRQVDTTNGNTLNFFESSSSNNPGSVFELQNDLALKIDPNRKKTICALMDTQPAVSGGPLYTSDNQGNFSIIGIHSGGNLNRKKNFATRIDETIIKDFNDIMNTYVKK